MAKRSAEVESQDDIPEVDEFEKVTADAQSASAVGQAPWWAHEEGSSFYGRLLGMYRLQGTVRGAREYLQVITEIPSLIRKKGSKKSEAVPAGTVISIGYSKGLDVFFTKHAAMLDAGATFKIGAKCIEKIETKGGNSFWVMKTKVKPLKSPTGSWQPYVIGGAGAPNGIGGDAAQEEAPF